MVSGRDYINGIACQTLICAFSVPLVFNEPSTSPARNVVTESPAIYGKFWKSIADPSQCPIDEVPEVAFIGRSNSGKSSALNHIAGSRRLSRVSKTPGRTQLINLINADENGRLVDLPGYGYARVAQKTRSRWSKMVNGYLIGRSNLVGLVLLMDIRHPLQDQDRQVISWAEEAGLPLLVLLSKADKISRGRGILTRKRIVSELGNESEVSVELFSVLDRTGVTFGRDWVRACFVQSPLRSDRFVGVKS